MRTHIIFRCFVIPALFTFCLLSLRIIYTGSFTYLFIAWNLFLAWVPSVFSTMLSRDSVRFKPAIFTAWLVLWPNSFYLVTDLVHLHERSSAPFWFDTLLLFSAVINGITIGYLSFSHVEHYLRTVFSYRKTRFIIPCCFVLCSFGIYLGRYSRWNSWDVLFSPLSLFKEIMERFLFPFQHTHTWAMSLLFGSFFYLFYTIIRRYIIADDQ